MIMQQPAIRNGNNTYVNKRKSEGQIKLSLCLIRALYHEDIWGSEAIIPLILNLAIR
jgi:hypothetical protein